MNPAHAQSASPVATGTANGEEEVTTLGTMTVTAQKREEILQDVPITLTVLPQQVLQDTGVRDIKDMQVLVPGLTVTSTQAAQTTARIRGMARWGQPDCIIVGGYRGVYRRATARLGALARSAHEVLKGRGHRVRQEHSPGVINVITRAQLVASAEPSSRGIMGLCFAATTCFGTTLRSVYSASAA